MKSEDVEELLSMIQRAQPQELRKDNMFDAHTKIYSTLRAMYQHFKKNHELQIMQAQFYKIPYDQYHVEEHKGTPVTASLLFDYHQLGQGDILRMIDMKDELKEENRAELDQQILKAINEQQSVSVCLKCYRTLLKKQFQKAQKGTPDSYELIEKKMIDKLLRFDKFSRTDTKIINKHIISLPKIGRPILSLMSHLDAKIPEYKDFEILYKIFFHNQPTDQSREDFEALFRICRPETLKEIKKILENENQEEREMIKEVLQKEAKNKLANMDLEKTSKTIHILNFIVEVVKCKIFIWPEIIQWEHRASQQPKNMLKKMVQSIIVKMIQQPQNIEFVSKIAEKLTLVDQHSQIGLIVMRELLELSNKTYLSHRIIRRFLAIKILKYNSSQNYARAIFNKNMAFCDILLQMFEFRANVFNFYQNVVNNPDDFQYFNQFMVQLANKRPQKLVTFAVKLIQIDSDKCDLFTIKSKMMNMFVDKLHVQTASAIVKQLCINPPTRNLLTILTKLMIKFDGKQSLTTFKANVVRSLNIMLTRIPPSEINLSFQVQFPGFLKEYLMKETNDIFNEVSAQTKQELKKNFEMSHKRFG